VPPLQSAAAPAVAVYILAALGGAFSVGWPMLLTTRFVSGDLSMASSPDGVAVHRFRHLWERRALGSQMLSDVIR
jgi:hypothetical protein